MKRILPLIIGWATLSSRAEDLVQRYSPYGQLIVTELASAPFPHPSRADGHKYKDQVYPAKEHYSDSTVAIFVPRDYRETGEVDLVVHFHGWKNTVEGVLGQFKLIEQLADSGRNAVLVVPQGPRNAPDSSGGKLEDPGGFKRFIGEVVSTLREKSSLKRKEFNLGGIILSGHSGGYKVSSAILDGGGLTDHVREVWLFDALYAGTDKFLAWTERCPKGRLINIYTQNGGTKNETERMMSLLKQTQRPFFAGKDVEAKPADLQDSRLIFLYTDLGHNDVLEKRQTFRDYLKTSFLGPIRE